MKRKLLNQIQELIDEGEKFTFSNFCYPHMNRAYGGEDRPEWLTWKTRSLNLTMKIAAPDSPATTLAKTAIGITTSGNRPKHFERLKETMIQALKLAAQSIKKDAFGELKKETSESSTIVPSNKVFVVHGHDLNLKMEVENFLIEIGLEPIILHKKPDQGQTIIEKFEKHSDVGYAFVLLTPDEIAYTINQEDIPDSEREKEERARPNVIFEFGYFAGRLGRNRVCCLYKEGVVVPSDLKGLLYKQIRTSIKEKAYEIMQELNAAGYEIKIKGS